MNKAVLIILSICLLAILQNCSSSKKVNKTAIVISFDKDVMPILQSRCTPCHFPPEGRKQALNTYDAVKANINEIISRVKMPQEATAFMPFKSKKAPLSDSLINILQEWQKQNMPQ